MNTKGTNNQDNKLRNKLLVLKLICTRENLSRADIAETTGLTRMTAGNLVSELISDKLISEQATYSEERSNQYGRKPISLSLSDEAPCICGILIKRSIFHFIVGTLDGRILHSEIYEFDNLNDMDHLLQLLYDGYEKVLRNCTRRIIAIGISSVGPLNTRKGIILNPPFFYGIHDIPVVSFFQEKTGLPTFLINDANAGALAEILYGSMKNTPNFLYMHLMNGIGTGIVINGTLYEGDSGQSGEIGHMSINFAGPLCDCGNKGCLELYANTNSLRQFISDRKHIFPASQIAQIEKPKWRDIIEAANKKETLALMALDQHCEYLSTALVNSLKLLNLSTIVIGYENPGNEYTIENILETKLIDSVKCNVPGKVHIHHSFFEEQAPLIGSIAVVAQRIFQGEFDLA